MADPLFTDQDFKQIETHGLPRAAALRQVELFTRPPVHAALERPATLGDGLQTLAALERERCEALNTEAARAGRLSRFVPASGAASRLFRGLDGAADSPELRAFAAGLRRFPFYDDLKEVLKRRKLDPAALVRKGDLAPLLAALLEPSGLDYAALPKGLLPCHREKKAARTLFEEHLLEAAGHLADGRGLCRLHFTVSTRHEPLFERFAKKALPAIEKELGVRFELSFSLQSPSTDTLAVDRFGRPFRTADGRLLLRPGGHGALLANLNAWRGDIVHVKNIDNAVPRRLREESVRWKRALAGLLIDLQEEIFRCIGWVHQHPEDERVTGDALRFLSRRLAHPVPPRVKAAPLGEKRRYLLSKLNRPLRVCGMVRHDGEPGGGPFWVKNKHGDLSLQIVEGAQVDPASEEQRAVLEQATHFNPVDMVLGVRDWRGQSFDLRRFADPDAVLIARKTAEGREVLALEHPGLWCGGMADWNTVFVEIPGELFQPIKALDDLLRPGHQEKASE